jgi:hypothetical protein
MFEGEARLRHLRRRGPVSCFATEVVEGGTGRGPGHPSQHQSLPGRHRRMSRRTRLSQPGLESSPLDSRAMFRGSSISSSHRRGSTPCSIARRSTCPFAASLSASGSRTMPEACSFASTCSPAARRFLISASTVARQALNSRRLSNAATTTCRRSRRAGSYRYCRTTNRRMPSSPTSTVPMRRDYDRPHPRGLTLTSRPQTPAPQFSGSSVAHHLEGNCRASPVRSHRWRR